MIYLKKFNEGKKNKPNYKRIIEGDFVIFQGKDSESNDFVTLELANDNDIWFHAKGVPGSHVVLKVRDKIPDEDVIKKAATIAAKNSKSKEDSVKVVYCKKKFVTKESNMNPGQVRVDYLNANEIIIKK